MDLSGHKFRDLFRQLGLADDTPAIESFIAAHRPLPGNVALADAPFWTPGQSQFLREEIVEDADWAELVDSLDTSLRQ